MAKSDDHEKTPAKQSSERPSGKRDAAKRAKAPTRAQKEQGDEPAVSTSSAKSQPAAEKLQRSDSQRGSTPSFVVGIGASAGGLETYETFFQAMPPDNGMAFVLVPHLEPTHVSMLPELLQRSTQMQVRQVTDGMVVQADHLYIIPPDCDLGIMNGTLHLTQRQRTESPRAPINYFFRSLAVDQHEKAIGIVFSGMGSDGALGLKAIKEEMGMTMAQEPATAKYPGMPKSAIATGLVDFILPAEKMPEKLIQYAGKAPRHQFEESTSAKTKPSHGLSKIFYLIRSVTGHDLSSYKRSTIIRRVERRMKLHEIENLTQYVRYLESSRHEVEALFKEILINVTSFFRDPEAFEILAQKALPQLLASRADDDTVRIWIPGCSTGEEAYSVAMLLREYMEDHDRSFKPQIFGTDIDEEAIETARVGTYPATVAADLGPLRLKRFFDREGSSYRIKKDIREMLVFAKQDLIKDPPFTKLDMVCCRNLLIYLESEPQKKVLSLFHYALKSGGVLFLGTSESIGEYTEMFAPVDKKWRLFTRKGRSGVEQPILDILPRQIPEATTLRHGREPSLGQYIEGILLDRYAPACVVINAKGGIHYIHGRTGRFLEPAPGAASTMNIFHMAREGLKLQLPSAVRRAASQRKEQVCERVRVKTNGGFETVNVTVSPITQPETTEGLIMVLFEVAPSATQAKTDTASTSGGAQLNEQIADLERELNATRESLQTSIEELETGNEELKSMNEEYQSTNEELKSANEELETSREELQSLNEELTTVNAELQEKIDGLSRSYRDIKDYLDGLGLPVLFLDNELRIKRFNSHVSRLISNLIEGDIGRPMSHIVSKLKNDRLVEDATQVYQTLRPVEKRVQTADGQWFFMRILPYRTSGDLLDGVVMTFLPADDVRAESTALEQGEALDAGTTAKDQPAEE